MTETTAPRERGADSRAPLEERLRRLFPALASAPPALLAGVDAEAREVVIPRGTRVFDEHAPCTAFPLVLEGSIRVAKLAPNGREILLYRVGPGEACVLSSGCLLGRVDYAATGVTETDVRLATLSQPLFDELLAAHAGFRHWIFTLFSGRIADLMMLVEEVAFHRLDQRLAALLLERGPDLHASHQALADELGSVREIVSRLLGSFEDRGIVGLARNHIRVTDHAALARIAASN